VSAPPNSASGGSGRGGFGSRIGFIFAAAGSAIGLGNIWRFPYTAGENGGGAFVLVYLVFVLGIGVPVLLAELAVGRNTQKSPVGAFKALFPESMWPMVGGLGVVTGFAILSFYSVVAGWTLSYLWKATTGVFGHPMTAEDSGKLFGELIGDPGRAIALSGGFLLLTILVVRKGVSGGIETASKVLMPLFFVLLVILAGRSLTLDGAGRGLEFMFKADFSKLGPKAIMSALGQALFSLSLGMGAMITYGSYLSRKEHLPLAGLSVAFFDTLIALLGGLIIFPALFHANADPGEGPGLVFVVLPTIFDKMPSGTVFAIAFYALLAVAALTSTISLLEVVVSYFVDERGWAREKAAWLLGGGCFLLSIPSALSNGAVSGFSALYRAGDKDKSFLDLLDTVFGNYSLSLGALLLSLFVGWKWGVKAGLAELESDGEHRLPLAAVWAFCIRFICPVAVLLILISMVTGQ
jgi:neurotransmitter:Na+ symporter, NSS family